MHLLSQGIPTDRASTLSFLQQTTQQANNWHRTRLPNQPLPSGLATPDSSTDNRASDSAANHLTTTRSVPDAPTILVIQRKALLW